MAERSSESFPAALYIATYDISGYDQATGAEKFSRRTGIVTHTRQLIDGLFELEPSADITVFQTASPEGRAYDLTTPEGHTVLVTSLDPTQTLPTTDMYNPRHAVHDANARQCAADLGRKGIRDVLVQNPYPLIGILQAEERDYINPDRDGQLRVTTVIHDSASHPRRFDYIKDRLGKTRMDMAFIAISSSVRAYMLDEGLPETSITQITNGINSELLDERLNRAKKLKLFETVQARDNLPGDKKLILCTAARVRRKGHEVIIQAAKMLKEQGKLEGAYIAFAGKNVAPAKSIDQYTAELKKSIREEGLGDDIFMLSEVTLDELAACYGAAYITLLPSLHSEGVPYSTFESMVAGVPAISSRDGGPLDFITHEENGMFVEPGSAADLASAIDRLLCSPELHQKISLGGRRTVEAHSAVRMARQYIQVMTR